MTSPMSTTSPRARRLAAGAAAVLCAGSVLTACSGGEDEPESTTTPTETPSATQESSEATAPAPEDTLTEPGSQLAFGDTASVEYTSQGRSALLDITVRSAERGSLDDFTGFDTEDPQVAESNPFYVRVQVENVGRKPFGNAEVPLWGVSGEDTLLPPVRFTASFQPCPTENLPAGFAKGDTFSTCLVFLSPRDGSLEGVSYRPTEQFTPIEWRGPVEKPGGSGSKGGKPGDGGTRKDG